MNIAKLIKNAVPQSKPLIGSGQSQNSAGGNAWTIDSWKQLDRFLILGSTSGTYYVAPRQLVMENCDAVIRAIREDGLRVVNRITEISHAGRAPKNDPAIYALALAATHGNEETRKAAFAALPKVARTGTHLFQFAESIDGLRGWGRGLRRAVGDWYLQLETSELAYQLLKYGQRGGWSHRDMLRLAHPKTTDATKQELFRWVTQHEMPRLNARVIAAEQLKKTTDVEEAVQLIREHRLPREVVNTELLNEQLVWKVLFEEMPMTAAIRNLGNLTKIGVLSPKSAETQKLIEMLTDAQRLKKARVHPLTILLAQRTYASGQGFRGQSQWKPVPAIVEALDQAFYSAFANVEPTGKRFYLGLDVSGSMGWSFINGSPISAREAAAAMAMLTLRTEAGSQIWGFGHEMVNMKLTPEMNLSKVISRTSNLPFGGTDCALPMLHALKEKMLIDAFVVYTDSETWFGQVHPVQALKEYRKQMKIDAKLIVVGMTANQFSIADPNDAGMLDVVGFDSSVPDVIAQFVQS